MADPWLKFYTSDWRSDPRLRMCSMAARGLWVEMICLMHEASPYGHLLVGDNSPTDAQLAVLVGATPEQVTALLGELHSAGVFSKTRAGVIYSRKLTRMAKKTATARNNGRKGGNPSLGKETVNPALDKGTVKARDKPQKPEARIQSNSVSKDTGAKPPPDPEKIMFDSGVALLGSAGIVEPKARSILGKWRRDHGTEATIAALSACQRAGAIQPVEFIQKTFTNQRAKGQPQDGDRRAANGRQEVYAHGMGWVEEVS